MSEAAAVLNALMRGTARAPLPFDGPLATGIDRSDPNAVLTLLALAGQASRFDRPSAPAAYDPVVSVADPRAIISPLARTLLLRLVAGKGNAHDAAARAAARAMAQRRLRPHPFDLPRLDSFVRHHRDDLGATALAWTANGEPEPTGYFEVEEPTAETWRAAAPMRKAAFIAALRASDPAAARALIQAQLPTERADVRARLVATLATGLGEDDRALLETLAVDRAPRVQEVARRLLARVPGTEAAANAVNELLARLTLGKAGLIRRRRTLSLQLPADVRPVHALQWLTKTFATIGLGQIAAGLGLAPAELIDAARDDAALLTGLAFAASVERNFAALRAIAAEHPDLWTQFMPGSLETLGLDGPADRAAWASAVLPMQWTGMPGRWQLETLHGLLDAPLPVAVAEALLDSRAWESGDGEWAVPLAALTPDPLAGRLRERLGTLAPEQNARALLLIDLRIELARMPIQDATT